MRGFRVFPRTVFFIAGLAVCCVWPVFPGYSAGQPPAPLSLRRVQALYDRHEKECLQKGWHKIVTRVNGRERKLLWKAPDGPWTNGAVIALHGGGGTFSNFCSNIPLGKPMEEFSELALREGFAVFSPDSGYNIMRDKDGFPCGKRWDCLARGDSSNPDMDFLERVIDEVIPSLRPAGSGGAVFLTGISNGGFMITLAAERLSGKVAALAPVSAGTPFSTFMDCSDTSTVRISAPGRWYDADSGMEIRKPGACAPEAGSVRNEPYRAPFSAGIPFKHFHHEGDGGVDISCMRKARRDLSRRGFDDSGPYVILNRGRKSVWKHFWQKEYNKPLIDFFKSVNQKRKAAPSAEGF